MPKDQRSNSGVRRAAAAASRRRLLDAAREQFSSRPYAEVTAADITTSAGVASGLLFHHFDSKRGIYLAVLDEAVTALHATTVVDERAPAGRRVRELLQHHLDFMAENEQLAVNVILRQSADDEGPNTAIEATRWDVIAWATRALGLDADHAVLRGMWRSFAAAADDLTVRWLQDGRVHQVGDLVEAIVELLIGALRAAVTLDPTLDVAPAIAKLRRARP